MCLLPLRKKGPSCSPMAPTKAPSARNDKTSTEKPRRLLFGLGDKTAVSSGPTHVLVQTGASEQPWVKPQDWVQLANSGLQRPWVQSHDAIHGHGGPLVWTACPEWAPSALGRSLQPSDIITPGGRLTLEPKLLLKPCLSCTAVPRLGPTWAAFLLPAQEITPLRLAWVSTPRPLQSLLGLWAWEPTWKSFPCPPPASFKECL